MKKTLSILFFLIVVSTMVFSQAKPGGIAREAAMGGSQAGTGLVLNPFIMDDPSLMLVNPAYQAWYRDYGWVNIAGGALTGTSTGGGPVGNDGYGHQNAGVAFSLNDSWNLGGILSYDPTAVNFVSTTISGVAVPGFASFPSIVQGRAPQPIPAVANVWEVVASHHVSSMDLGLGFMYGWSNSDLKNSAANPRNTEASSNMFGFRAGAIFNLTNEDVLDLSGALRFENATDKIENSGGSAGNYSASGTEFQFTGRLKCKASNKVNFIPYGFLGILNADPKENTPPVGTAATTVVEHANILAYGFGAGGEYRTQTFYLAGGVSWQSARLRGEYTPTSAAGTTTNTTTYSAIPVVNLGAEWWFTDWLAGRGGYYRSIGNVNIKSESNANVSEGNVSAPNSFVAIGGLNPATWDGLVTLGLGFKFGNWSLDATVSDEALRRGLGLIGAQDNINTFGYMTASYNFAE